MRKFYQDLVIPLAVTATVSIVASAAVTHQLVTSNIEVAMQEIPLFAVAGYKRIDESAPINVNPEDLGRAYDDMNTKIESLMARGYTVLDERMVISAPENLYVPHMRLTASWSDPAARGQGVPKPVGIEGMTMDDLKPEAIKKAEQARPDPLSSNGFPGLFDKQ